MPRYRYRATDGEGESRTGVEEASGPDDLASRLSARGLRLEEAEIEGGGKGALSASATAELTAQLAGLTATGRALPEGLRALASELQDPMLAGPLRVLADDVEGGRPLEKALSEREGMFPPSMRGLVHAAARSGRVAEVLGESARLQRVGVDLRRRLWMSLLYPFALLAFFLLVFVGLSVTIVGEYEKIFEDFGLQLPRVTVVMVQISRFLRSLGWGLPVAAIVIAVGAAALGMFSGDRLIRRWASKLPLVGPLWRFTSMAEYSHLLALLVDSRIALPEALPMAGDATRDEDLAWASREAAKRVKEGASLAEAVSRTSVYPAGFAKLLSWAEANRSLPEALHVAGEIFEARARPQATFVGAFFMVVVITLVLLGVSLLLTALYLPLIQLISELSG